MTDAPEPLCADLGWLLSRASHVFTTELTAAMEDLGISPRARCVLTTAATGQLTQIEIARAIGLDKTTLVVTLDELEAQGLVERRPSPADRRVRVVAVTRAGQKMLRRAEEVSERVQQDVLSSLPARQRDGFVDALRGLVAERLAEPAACSKPVRQRAA